jgi:hypothetical protein
MIIVKVRRPCGKIEEIETKSIPFSQKFLDKAYADTKAAGRGEILSLTNKQIVDNIGELRAKYNNIINEGGEGYIPDDDYFKKMPTYKKSEYVKVLEPK